MKKLLPVFCFAVAFTTWVNAQIPTWSQDIAAILYANCTKCHHPNGAGHFSLLTFSDAYSYAYQMEAQTAARNMPPWPPDENYKHFARERVLSQSDIDKISDWVAAGRPQGDVTLAPTQPTYPNTSALGAVDLSVRIPTYTVGANNDVYRNFPITTNVPAGRYITGIEVIPGNTHIVHHVLIFHDSTNVPAQLDANQVGPGYTNAGGTGSLASKLLGGWTPGASPYYTPVGTGFRLPANTNIVVQVHYPAGSVGLVDSTRINFKLTTVPQREITVYPILNHLQNIDAQINIPAGQTRTYNETETLPATDYTFLSAFPHMHLIGTSIKSWANKPSTNDTIRFVNIPKWDFQWQDTYVFPNAVKVPAGSTLRAVANYDNTTNNPNHLNQTVVAGEATTEEMMMVFFGFMPYVNGDENLIVDRRILPQSATTFCNGQAVELKMIEGAGYTYQWYRNGSVINGATSFSYIATQAGNYHALITLGTNNSLTDTIAVNLASAPLASVTPNGSTAICAGSNVTLNAATGSGYSYQWFNNGTPILNATSSSYTASAAGSYTVQVYNGCYANSSAVSVTSVSAPSNMVTAMGATTFCQGGNVTLSAQAGLSYQWSNNATTQNITVTQNGSYTVTVSNGNNCTAVSLPTAVTVNSLPSATVTPNGATTFCQGGSVSLSATAGLSYNWSNNAVSQAITVAQSGVYLVTVTNGNNCSAVSSSTTVTVNALPNASITPSGPISFCAGGSVMLTATSNTSYHWGNNAATQSITVNQSGNYQVTVTNANNCSNVASVSVAVHPLPNAVVTSNQSTTICPGDSITLSAVAGMSYNWSNNATTQSITVSTAGIFIVTVTDNNSCSASSVPDTVIVSNNAIAGITPSGSTTFCEGSSVELTASAGTVYQWSNNAATQSIIVDASGSFTVSVTMSGSCTAVSSPINVLVNQNPSVPVITASGPAVFCEGGAVSLTGPSGYSYQWSSGETTSSITVTQTDNYIVTVTDVNSCSASSVPTVVIVNNLPTVTLSGNAATLCSDASAITLYEGVPSGGAFSGAGVNGNLFDPSMAGVGIHNVIYSYTDNNGCTGIANEAIQVSICSRIKSMNESSFFVSPNPSHGSVLVRWNGTNSPHAAMKIFDISGKLIYSSLIEKLQTAINLQGVYSGCYLLQLKTQNQTYYQKLIVQD